MKSDDAHRLLVETTTDWVNDPESDVVWAGEHEGQWGIRLAQQCREATTVWFTVGELTVGFEAYLLPAPTPDAEAVYRHCLTRNRRSWPAFVAIDRKGDLYVQGRIPLTALDAHALDQAVGAVYELVELSFQPLLRLGYLPREKRP